ncbi:hypothetical protein T4D_6496 [Trichinella pseudospiralis]|uniref:Uncharacterized protein n=1 Tax=Trichinella pseudospiralis TaxID=6337 RepID=A0A0V1F8R6_TRIPS|nr:hypothetical protein T4D_6496 [Trichinella pseudospiralis]
MEAFVSGQVGEREIKNGNRVVKRRRDQPIQISAAVWPSANLAVEAIGALVWREVGFRAHSTSSGVLARCQLRGRLSRALVCAASATVVDSRAAISQSVSQSASQPVSHSMTTTTTTTTIITTTTTTTTTTIAAVDVATSTTRLLYVFIADANAAASAAAA